VRTGGIVTLLVLGACIAVAVRREKARAPGPHARGKRGA